MHSKTIADNPRHIVPIKLDPILLNIKIYGIRHIKYNDDTESLLIDCSMKKETTGKLGRFGGFGLAKGSIVFICGMEGELIKDEENTMKLLREVEYMIKKEIPK